LGTKDNEKPLHLVEGLTAFLLPHRCQCGALCAEM